MDNGNNTSVPTITEEQQDKIYEERRNERLKSLCQIMENKSTEIALRSTVYATLSLPSKKRLSFRVFRFLYGNAAEHFFEETKRTHQTTSILKYIIQNNLLPTLEEKLKKRQSSASRYDRLIMALNIQFGDDGYQNAPNSNAPQALERTRSRDTEEKESQNTSPISKTKKDKGFYIWIKKDEFTR